MLRELSVVILCVHVQLPNVTPKDSLRIFGGRDAKEGEYPFAVRIEMQSIRIYKNTNVTKTSHLCTGSALTPTTILTAAHCLEAIQEFIERKIINRIIKIPVIRYGSPHMKPSENDKHSLILRTEYPKGEYSDIALLYTESIQIERYGKISALDYKALYGHEAVLLGFGIMARNVKTGKFDMDSLKLNKPLQIIDRMLLLSCDTMGISGEAQLCAVPLCGEVQQTTAGDSGSPIIHSSGIVGVLKGGTDNNAVKTLGGKWSNVRDDISYMIPVSAYLDWIHFYVSDDGNI